MYSPNQILRGNAKTSRNRGYGEANSSNKQNKTIAYPYVGTVIAKAT